METEDDVERINLTKEEYHDIIQFTLLKSEENIPVKKKEIKKDEDVKKNLKSTVGWDDENTLYLYFYPLKPKDVWTEDELKAKTVKQLDSIIEQYNTSKGGKELNKTGNKEEKIKKMISKEIPKGIKPKLFDLQSIWDDEEDLMVPPPSSLGLAARKAREFMVFE